MTLFFSFIFFHFFGQIFGNEQIIIENELTPSDFIVDDINNDGYSDIAFTSYSQKKVAWLENDGNQNFLVEHVLIDNLDQVFLIRSLDAENDGDIDFIISAGSDIYISINNGLGEFDTEQIVENNTNQLFELEISDLNNDGFLDFAVANTNHFATNFHLMVFENDGLGNFIFLQDLGSGIFELPNIYFLHLNSDQYLDILLEEDGYIRAYKKQSDGFFDFGEILVLSDVSANLEVIDYDNDLDLDILLFPSSGTSIKYMENIGNGNFSDLEDLLITNGLNLGGKAADIDLDGNVDLIFEKFGNVHYSLNTQNQFIDLIPITDNFSSGSIIKMADLDGDNLNDLIISKWNEGEIIWFKNANQPVFVNELSHSTLEIYPNPSKEKLNITIPSDLIDYTFSVYDSQGKFIHLESILISNSKLELNIDELNSGVYQILIESDQIIYKNSFIKN